MSASDATSDMNWPGFVHIYPSSDAEKLNVEEIKNYTLHISSNAKDDIDAAASNVVCSYFAEPLDTEFIRSIREYYHLLRSSEYEEVLQEVIRLENKEKKLLEPFKTIEKRELVSEEERAKI